MDGFGALVAESIGPSLDAVKVSRGGRALDVGTGAARDGVTAAVATQRSWRLS